MFYRIRHRTFHSRGTPWITEFVSGTEHHGDCEECGAPRRECHPEMVATLKRNRCRLWTDLIGCGHLLLMVMSETFVNAMRGDGMRVETGGRVTFAEPLCNGLSLADAPSYFWIDGGKMRAASMDYEASGYVGAQKCSRCGGVQYDVGATFARMHEEPPPPIVFDYDESLGFDLFTTDMTPLRFFCTERVLACAKRHRLANIAFSPVEAGLYANPIKY